MFYDKFIELCKGQGISPSAVMVSIGLNKSNATFWKKGSMPSSDTLQKLADYFGVSVDYLLDLTPEELEDLQDIEDYVVKESGRNKEDVHRYLLNEKILDIPVETYNNAVEAADAAIITKFKNVPDKQLRNYIIENYNLLNRRGKIEAVMRIEELSANDRFNKRKGGQISSPFQPDVGQKDGVTKR